MEHLNRVAVPVSALGLILLLFAVIWREGVQLAVADASGHRCGDLVDRHGHLAARSGQPMIAGESGVLR